MALLPWAPYGSVKQVSRGCFGGFSFLTRDHYWRYDWLGGYAAFWESDCLVRNGLVDGEMFGFGTLCLYLL